MKAKCLFITVFLFLQWQMLLSQCISVELSITWEMENHIYYKDTMVNLPKLNITYRNNCDSNYYFLKVSNSKDSFPSFGCLITHYPSNEKPDCHQKINYNAKRYTNQILNVGITKYQRYQIYGTYWSIYSDSFDTNASYPAWVECALQDIHECIRNDNNLTAMWGPKWQFEPQDVLPENILDSVSDQFVFLKSGEIFTDTYNLVAFQIIEGCYTFVIDQEDIKNYVLSSETIHADEGYPVMNQKGEITIKTIWHELELPTVVGEYQLYSGTFNTNKVTVCFGEK
jgi:hypothetical protein